MKGLTLYPGPLSIYIYLVFAFTFLPYPQFSLAIESRKIEKMIEEAQPLEEKEALLQEKQILLEQGKEYYFNFCVHCHGTKGKGDGRASHHLFPQPRELSQGIFKFHATQTNTLPLDDDIFRTIKRGVPGTAMPAWEKVLSDQAINCRKSIKNALECNNNQVAADTEEVSGAAAQTPAVVVAANTGEVSGAAALRAVTQTPAVELQV